MFEIHYSRGRRKFDNQPEQCVANDFDEFADQIAQDISAKKGLAYICAQMSSGPHDNPKEHDGNAHWRLASHALPRRFLCLDADWFSNAAAFNEVVYFLGDFKALIYTTASHTAGAPRARFVIELNRCVDRAEGIALGKAFNRLLENEIGLNQFRLDESTHRAEQPVYTPVVGSEISRSVGCSLDVDQLLRDYPAVAVAGPTASPGINMFQHLMGFTSGDGKIGAGSRNDAMLKYTSHLRGRGMNEQEIVTLALGENIKRFEPPLDEPEVLNICKRYSHQNKYESGSESDEQPSHVCFFNSQDGVILVPTVPPPKREYTMSDQVTAGTLFTLGGSGGTSKTMLMLQVVVAAAAGMKLGSMQVAEGSSMLFLGEEDQAERDRRIGAICDHMKVDRKQVAKRVKCFPAAGKDIRLTLISNGNPQTTPLVQDVIALATAHEEECGTPLKLIVFDHARLVLGGDPNAADHVTQLTRALTHIAHETGATVVLLAHSPKSVLSKTGREINAADIAGSSAFVDNSRAAFMMYGMRDDEAKRFHISDGDRTSFVRLENVKANYAKTGGGYWFKRVYLPDWDVAILEEVRPRDPGLLESKNRSLRQRILDVVRKKSGGMSVRRLRDLSGKDGIFKASESKVNNEIEEMLNDGLLIQRKPTAEERATYRLTGQVQDVLAIGEIHETCD